MNPEATHDFDYDERIPAPAPAVSTLQRLLQCNPFYLASAAMLLFGIYILWGDTEGLSEVDHLLMNFLTIHGYEMMLVATAIALASRKVWYDSTLLIVIENVILWVPFVLLSQATWLGNGESSTLRITAGVAAASALLVIVRVSAVKLFFRELLLPRRLLLIGTLLLGVNIALPFVFNYLHQVTPEEMRADILHQALFLAIVVAYPLLSALINVLPNPASSAPRVCESGLLPWQLFTIWLAATGYHLWALMYVYDVMGEDTWIIPSLWVVAWSLYHRREDLFPACVPWKEKALLLLPLAIFAGAGTLSLSPILMGLTLANATFYALILYRRHTTVTLTLLLVSLAGTAAFIPIEWGQSLSADFQRGHAMIGALLLLLIISAALIRNMAIGLLGAAALAILCGRILPAAGISADVTWQVVPAFLLLHSLRWSRDHIWFANSIRVLVISGWLLATLKWLHFAEGWQPGAVSCTVALLVLALYAIRSTWTWQVEPKLVAHGALAILLLQPIYPIMDMVVEAGPGMIVITISFLLFAVGTCLALNRERWLHHPPTLDLPDDQTAPATS